MTEQTTKPLLSNAWYDRLKFIALVLLPALGTLYFSLAGIWNLPAAEQVVGTIVAVDTFLGLLLKFSDSKYRNSEEQYDASIVKTQTGDGQLVYAIQFENREQMLAADGRDGLYLKVK